MDVAHIEGALCRINLRMVSTLEFGEREVLAEVTRGLVEDLNAALARIWLFGPGDLCAACIQAPHCSNRASCLHLVASAGLSERLGGDYRRIPRGALKVGWIAETGTARGAAVRHCGRKRGDPTRVGGDRERSAHAVHRAAARRNGDREGTARQRATRAQPAARTCIREGQLRCDLALLDRERALRPREGSIHWCAAAEGGAVRARPGWNPFPRRDWRTAPRRPSEASACCPRTRDRAYRRHEDDPRRCADHLRDQPQSGSRRPREALPR